MGLRLVLDIIGGNQLAEFCDGYAFFHIHLDSNDVGAIYSVQDFENKSVLKRTEEL